MCECWALTHRGVVEGLPLGRAEVNSESLARLLRLLASSEASQQRQCLQACAGQHHRRR